VSNFETSSVTGSRKAPFYFVGDNSHWAYRSFTQRRLSFLSGAYVQARFIFKAHPMVSVVNFITLIVAAVPFSTVFKSHTA